MEARAKLGGHPLHQMLVPVPLGLLVSGALLDCVARATGNATLGVVSFWNLAIGVVTGLVAASFGVVDWLAIPRGTRAKRVGAVHALGNVAMLGLFAVAVALRSAAPGRVSSTFALSAEIVGLVLGAIAGWLGGELVDRFGVGVRPDASLDAPPRSSGHARGPRSGPFELTPAMRKGRRRT